MASNNDNDHEQDSPMHLGLSGHHFSPEEIQDLLGCMGDHHEGDHQDGSTSHDGHEVTHSGKSGASLSGVSISASGPTSTDTAGSAADGSAPTSSSTGDVPEEAKAQARSERKRCREKQRRSDVNRQFNDLTQLLQKIDAEESNGEADGKTGSTVTSSHHHRLTFNPANRVDLIARTIILLEKLHDASKKRKAEIASLQQQLEEAKKAGEDTAMKLKEAMLAPPGQPMNKQFMMMVPMMMSSDGSGAAVPMMNPYMPPAAAMPQGMPQGFCPMPTQMPAVAPPTGHAHYAAAAPAPQPAVAQAPSAPAAATAGAPSANPPVAPQPMMATGAQTSVQHSQAMPGYPYMMQAPMAPGSYMMPAGAGMPGQQMTMVPHHMPQHHHPQMAMPSAQHHVASAHGSQNNHTQEEKDSSSPSLNGGSNLAHCA